MKIKALAPPSPVKTSISGIVSRSPADLGPWPGNPRVHPEFQMSKLMASMDMYGFTAPVLIDENSVILSGHARVQAALRLNLTEIPTRVISGLTKAKKRGFVLGDNKIGLLSSWNPGLLKSEIELLIQDDFEIETTGFTTAEIDLMFDDTPLPDPDDQLPELTAEAPVTQLGDLWALGAHRLLCGDALVAPSYQQVMAGELAQMIISDPPFNVKINGHVCGAGKHAEFSMASGEMSKAQFHDFLARAFGHLHAFAIDGSVHFIFMDWRHTVEIQAAAEPIFGPLRQLCIWVKDNGGMGTFYRSQHELVFVFKKGAAPHTNNFELGQHGRYRTNVWTYAGANSFKGKGHALLSQHPTVKPVGLIADAIRDCSHRKGLVLDPFSGSGTILIAAERTGRQARAIELEPKYCDVGIQRWQRMTGKQAVLASTGQTWDEVRAEREPALALDGEADDDL